MTEPSLFHLVLSAGLEPRSARIRGALFQVTLASPVGDRMYHNLLLEPHRSASDWNELITKLSEISGDIIETLKVVRDFCGGNPAPKRIGTGPQAKISSTVFGRVIPFESFCAILLKEGYHVEMAQARATVRAMLRRALDRFPEDWKRYPLGMYLMWSTFRPNEPDPFPETTTGGDLLSALGIERTSASGTILAFRYTLPTSIVPRVPTFCDAYAGPVWNPYFRVPPFGAEHGRVRPVGLHERRGAGEVVHEVITASLLAAPLEELP
jgi:hypothetical protein